MNANAFEFFVGENDGFPQSPAALAALGPAGLECAYVKRRYPRLAIEVDLDPPILIDPADMVGTGSFEVQHCHW